MNKIIALDIDGVIAGLLPTWVKWYNFDYRDNLDYRQIDQWDMTPFVKDVCGKDIYAYIKNPKIYDEVKLIHNSLWGVDSLKSMGYRIIYVTSTPVGCEGRKFSYLNDHGFQVSRKDYFEAEDKSLIASDYLVDDRDLNVTTAWGQGIVFTAEYNKTLTGYPRVNNWMEVVDFFSKQKDGQEIISI